MTHGSLFSGIGGFDLAAEWMGWENILHCEINPFGQKILKHYWPHAKSYSDITKTDFSIHRGTVDVLTGGFPCQPYSQAGKRLGTADDRHLWPEMLRAVREIQPRWIVGENVRGLTNWNGGLVFDEVQADLEAEGFTVLPFLLPACAVNAPHRRDRIWFIAYRHGAGFQTERSKQQTAGTKQYRKLDGFIANTDNAGANNTRGIDGYRAEVNEGREGKPRFEFRQNDGDGITPNANSQQRCERGMHSARSQEAERYTCSCDACISRRNTWEIFPIESPVCGGNDGLPSGLAGITFPKWRNESIKAFGNAIVPQVAHQIFQAIEQYETIIQ